ncbi:hypothetical protein [Streptomyces sp. Y7]|uniref:hypothetical protein n=1 Tax=Streptomyces sp. Y7 TaxID=3342392 RepID=UPI0037213659
MLLRVLALMFLWPIALLGLSGAAHADSSSYAVTSEKVVLERHEDGTGSFSVSIINLSDREVTVSPSIPGTQQEDCKAAVDSAAQLGQRRQASFKIKLTGCSLPEEDSFPVNITVDNEPATRVLAEPDPQPTPNWDLMKWFGAPLLAALAIVVITTLFWKSKKQAHWMTELKYLKEGWTLKDSLAADVSVLAAAFTGVFGVSAVLDVLGDESKPVLGLAAVASAVGVGLVGAAGFAVQALRLNEHVTALGFVVGAVLALGGTGGQMWVILLAARQLDLGWIGPNWLYGLGAMASLLLAVYAVTNTLISLNKGMHGPEEPPTYEETVQRLEELYQEISDTEDATVRRRAVMEYTNSIRGGTEKTEKVMSALP